MTTNMNPIKPNGEPKTRQKHPKQEQDQTHNLHIFTMVTNKNPTKTQQRPQNTSKTPQTRTESVEKTTETKKFRRKPPETHLIFSKTHNPLPFIFTTNENPTKHNGYPTHVKNTPNKNCIRRKKNKN